MDIVKALRALAQDYGLPGRLKLKKKDLLEAIVEVHVAEFIKRLLRAVKSERLSAIRGDVENPRDPWSRVGADQR